MKLATMVLFFCGSLLIQVNGYSMEARDDLGSNQQENDDNNRGLIDLVLGRPTHTHTNTQPMVVPPPLMPEQAPLSPTIPIAPVDNTHYHHRPTGLLNNIGNNLQNILGGISSSHEKQFGGLNLDWIQNALSKCAKIDPRQLTAIMPTATNLLREPRMYYFENSTSNAKNWNEAQQWCSKNGMHLATVNDINEERVLQDKLRQIFGGTLGNPAAQDNPNAYWIGLNRRVNLATEPWSYVGDSSSTFVDWHTVAPVEPLFAADPAGRSCVTMSQRSTADNIHYDARPCEGPAGTPNRLRFICEVSDTCVSLLMSRYRTQYVVPHHHHHSPLGNLLGPLNTIG